MASKDMKPISTCEPFKSQIDELKQMKMDLKRLKNKLIIAQTKYHQQLADYEAKFEQVHCQTEKVEQEQTEKETNLQNATAEWHDIKTRLESSVISPNKRVKLNVGGRYFETTAETLMKHNEETITYFKAIFSRQWELEKDPKDGSIFIDRNGDFFAYILNYLRTGQLIIDDSDVTFRRNLTIEAEFYKIESLISLLKINDTKPQNHSCEQRTFYSDTKILSSKYQEHLNKLYGINNQRWQLIYRASRDGFTAGHFHECCDDYGPTMTVIRSMNGFIFGGFTTVPWTSSNQDVIDAQAFLFTLKNPHEIKPTKYPVEEQSAQFAVSHRKISGPTFGSVSNGGSDIHLRDPFNAIGSRIHFPRSYKYTTGKVGGKTFTGDSHFSCEDVEVFLLVS